MASGWLAAQNVPSLIRRYAGDFGLRTLIAAYRALGRRSMPIALSQVT
jgi:hypothetical protein